MVDPKRMPNLTVEQKTKVGQWLLLNTVNGDLPRGAQKEAADNFGICMRTVRYIWTAMKEQLENGKPFGFQSAKVKGIQHKDKWVLDKGKVKTLSVLERSSLRKMAMKLNVSKSLLHRWVKQKQLRPHTNAIKPTLTELNKIARLRWSLSHLETQSTSGKLSFQSMHNTVHIDEKWFYITKTSDRYYLLPEEDEPYRSCKSKRFITKVMFMSTVSRPQTLEDGTMLFDGKFGIFPFTTQEPTKRNSKNRRKGTLETKPVQAITKEVIKSCIINRIIPAIKAKWPPTTSKHIIIQQDNAKPHISHMDPEFIAAANSDGFTIQLICQPPNSPDTNVNDLGFFRAIQTPKDEKFARDVDDLLRNVAAAYEELTPEKMNNVFLTLQGCYREIMKIKGGNNYKIPHMGKERHIRNGTLPNCLEVEEEIVKDCIDYLMQPQNMTCASYNIDPLQNALGY